MVSEREKGGEPRKKGEGEEERKKGKRK